MLDTYGTNGTSPVILAEPTPEGLVARGGMSSSQLQAMGEILDDGWTVYDLPTREGFVTNGELRYNRLTTDGGARIIVNAHLELSQCQRSLGIEPKLAIGN